MKQIIITDKNKFAGILFGNFTWAVLTPDIQKMTEALINKLGDESIVDADSGEFSMQFYEHFADLIFVKYEVVLVRSDESVVGRVGNTDTLLFNAEGTKLFLDASFSH